MAKIARVVGITLLGLSGLSVAQTAREIALWELGSRRYAEESPQARAFAFAGHTFGVADDQPLDNTRSQAAFEGRIQPLMDGRPLGPPSRALVRRGLADLGRYHLWYDAWLFRERASGRTTLWLARRLQPTDASGPRFEVVTVDPGGRVQRRVLRPWRLGTEYRLFRATQFVREGTWTVMPLSLDAVIGFVPLFLLVFPLGTAVVGVRLIRGGRRVRLREAAG
jgi:hypothetical protein